MSSPRSSLLAAFSAFLCFSVVPLVVGQPSAAGAGGLKAPVRLISSVSAVAPGASFDVALAYQLSGDWHIYWKNPGDTGMPPKVDWQLPPGFQVGELRFPAPRRHKSGPDDFLIVTQVLYGEPVILARLTAPDSLPSGAELTIGAKVTTLACLEICVMEKQDLSFALPVVADAAAVKPANAELFADAARRVPPADGRGKYITVSARALANSVAVGGSLDVEVSIDIKRGYHIQSNKPFVAGFIPTEVLVEPTPGIELGELTYPKAKERVDKALRMKLSEFVGQTVVKVAITKVTDEATGTSLTLAGIVTAQACAEKGGQCFPPETVAWSTTVALTGAKAAAAVRPETESEQLAATVADSSDQPDEEQMSVPMMLVFAFLGGIILNIMPCIWPVLSIKVMSFVQQAHDEPKRVFRLGLLFGLGILVSFWLLGVAAVAAKSAAGGATWGTQFANPTFVILMIVVLWVFGLSLFGVFEFNLPGAASGKLSAATTREGYAGSFLKGMVATVLATPCTAPLLGPAIAVAFTQTGVVIMLAMTAIGLGMAAPYVILGANPAWLKFLPKPGPWMDTFKQFTGFLLVGVIIWMLKILGDLLGTSGVVATATFMTFLGLACWMYGKITFSWSMSARMLGTAGVLVVALFGGLFAQGYLYTPPEETVQPVSIEGALARLPQDADWGDHTPWVRHQPGLDQKLASDGYTVFVNYTATWCTKCLIQKKTVIETDEVRNKMREFGVVPLKADFTRRPDWLAQEIKQYGRAGIPLNVIIPAGQPDKPIVLPLGLGKSDVFESLEQAGPSKVQPGTPVASAQASREL